MACGFNVHVVVSRGQPANIAFEHAVDLFAIIWARPGFYRPHFTLALVHKCQGEGTIAFIADKNGYHPEAHLVWTEHIGAVTFQLCLELPRGKGDGGPGRGGRGAGGGGRCARNRRGNRATACNQNGGCGHDGGSVITLSILCFSMNPTGHPHARAADRFSQIVQ